MAAGRDDDYRSCLFVRADLEGFAQRGWLTMLAGQSEGLSTDAGWSFKTFEVFVSGDGARVLQVQISGTQVMTTAYAGAIEVQITATQRITKAYYSAGAQLIAMRQYTTPTSSVLYFLHSDHLGSVSVTTCGTGCGTAGTVVARQKFDAWGNLRSGGLGVMPTDVAYTGQRENLEIGLHYFKARYYIPGLGRFLSADTIVPSPGNPQAFNRYSYTYNNPIKYTDPTGHKACDEQWGCDGKLSKAKLPEAPPETRFPWKPEPFPANIEVGVGPVVRAWARPLSMYSTNTSILNTYKFSRYQNWQLLLALARAYEPGGAMFQEIKSGAGTHFGEVVAKTLGKSLPFDPLDIVDAIDGTRESTFAEIFEMVAQVNDPYLKENNMTWQTATMVVLTDVQLGLRQVDMVTFYGDANGAGPNGRAVMMNPLWRNSLQLLLNYVLLTYPTEQ